MWIQYSKHSSFYSLHIRSASEWSPSVRIWVNMKFSLQSLLVDFSTALRIRFLLWKFQSLPEFTLPATGCYQNEAWRIEKNRGVLDYGIISCFPLTREQRMVGRAQIWKPDRDELISHLDHLLVVLSLGPFSLSEPKFFVCKMRTYEGIIMS